jgi:hypothetical protein
VGVVGGRGGATVWVLPTAGGRGSRRGRRRCGEEWEKKETFDGEGTSRYEEGDRCGSYPHYLSGDEFPLQLFPSI